MNKLVLKPVQYREGKMYDQIIYVPDKFSTPELVWNRDNWGFPGGIEPGFIVRPAEGLDGYFCHFFLYSNTRKDFVYKLRTESVEMIYRERLFYWEYFGADTVRWAEAVQRVGRNGEKL